MARPSFIYINGYPGVGKLTVARILSSILPDAKLFDNHSLIDATSMLFERSMPEYYPLRQQMRRIVLDAIAKSESTKHITWVFTDSQASDSPGAPSQDYASAAAARGSPFVSIILTCDLDENIRRLTSPSRGGANTKLTDVDILRETRETENIMHFGGELEREIDVTTRSPADVAEEIKAFVDAAL